MVVHKSICLSTIFILFFFGANLCVSSQQSHLSAKAQNLTSSLNALRQKPEDTDIQASYLKAFPQNFGSFIKLFGLHGQLYDGADFINLIPSLAEKHEHEVGKLLVGLGKDAVYDADAPNYLQHSIAVFASQHTETFVSQLQLLPKSKQNDLIIFLADVENHANYVEYQAIIQHLKTANHAQLANAFEVAREVRSHKPHE